MNPSPDREAWRAAVPLLRARVADVFDRLIDWVAMLEGDTRLASFHPAPESWSIQEVVEHLTLSHRYLLILAGKIRDKSVRRMDAGEAWPDGPPHFDHLGVLVSRELHWMHPEHMTPTGGNLDWRALLEVDREACFELIDSLPPGAGTLHRIRMSVIENDDRLDLYQYIEVIVLHAVRHLAQLERIRSSY